MNPFANYVAMLAQGVREGKHFPLGQYPYPAQTQPSPTAPTALMFSPHPDDEVVVGGLALRLLREGGWRIVNVAVTQGSNPARQEPRFQELTHCCRYIGFDLVQTMPGGLAKISPKGREQDPDNWRKAVEIAASLVAKYQPRAIFFPHDQDYNSTHIGTHDLVVEALKILPDTFQCWTVETEFWAAMANPNLMVELSEQHVADLITALSFHVAEVQRNPYHLSVPPWMMDNVRRGAEIVGGQGGAAPDYLFATLYRLRHWVDGRWDKVLNGGRNLPLGENSADLFR